jgi:hypothetical protein
MLDLLPGLEGISGVSSFEKPSGSLPTWGAIPLLDMLVSFTVNFNLASNHSPTTGSSGDVLQVSVLEVFTSLLVLEKKLVEWFDPFATTLHPKLDRLVGKSRMSSSFASGETSAQGFKDKLASFWSVGGWATALICSGKFVCHEPNDGASKHDSQVELRKGLHCNCLNSAKFVANCTAKC